ncbi:MAG: hypothetical protein DMF64_18940 [Acidobacteria bacterium]|nr:MAG: hypothetical protein DMF64_18940 [Acidobacteriota bacterium]
MTQAEKKKGFGGQWVDVFSTGTHTDDKGNVHEIDAAFLDQVAAHLAPDLHEPPAVIGHPKTDAPAHGWVCGLRVEGDMLQAQFCDVDPAFEEMVRKGKFKKRSASFYLDEAKAPGARAPQLRHVGFLGAQPPAVKGLRAIQFGEGEAVTFEPATFSEGEGMDKEEIKKTVGEQIAEWFKEKFGAKSDQAPASFSEGDVKKLIAEAVGGVEAKFTEEVKKRDTEIAKLKTQVDKHSGSAARAEIVSFCERLGAGKFLPAFKRMGVIEFMEVLADLSDEKISIASFTEENGKEVEKQVEIAPLEFFENFLAALPPFVEFGEKFGGLKVTTTGAEIVDPAEMEKLRAGMGIKPNGNGKGNDK